MNKEIVNLEFKIGGLIQALKCMPEGDKRIELNNSLKSYALKYHSLTGDYYRRPCYR